jgi:hypothetical protein
MPMTEKRREVSRGPAGVSSRMHFHAATSWSHRRATRIKFAYQP